MTSSPHAAGPETTEGAHLGLRVRSLEEAMERLSASTGYRWGEILDWDASFVRDGRTVTEHVRFTMSLDGPPHLELMEAADGIFATDEAEDFHHFGRWVSDYGVASATLESQGYREEVRGEDEHGVVRYGYFTKPGHIRLELCAMSEIANLRRWVSGDSYVGS